MKKSNSIYSTPVVSTVMFESESVLAGSTFLPDGSNLGRDPEIDPFVSLSSEDFV